MIRRCFRIYPLAICAVVAAFAFNLPVAGTESGFPDRSLSTFFSNLFLVQNFTHKTSAPLVLWSLPYEMQMYLFLPALFLFARKISSVLPLIGIVMSAMSFEYFRTRYFHEVRDFIYFTPMFMAGVIAFKLMRSGRQPMVSWKLWPVMVGIALLVFVLLNKYLLLADAALIIDAGTAILIGVAIPCFRQIPAGLIAKWSEQVAKYSYGIYLAHMFLCVWFCFLPIDSLVMLVRFAIFFSLLALLPVLSFRMIENPMIHLGVKIANGIRSKGAAQRTLSAGSTG
jgi:peptidoglycan/LPS O-acetylase OafA/YrhL